MKQTGFVMALMFFASAINAQEDPLRNLADQLSAGLGRRGPVKVAVLAFPHQDNHPSDGPVIVSERLTTLLAREKNIAVVERNHIVQMFGENGLSETGRLDPDAAKLMGEILGADILVLGTLINLNGRKTEVNLRGVSAKTGRVLAAARALIDRTWDERPVLAW